jgi:hypothetical protein
MDLSYIKLSGARHFGRHLFYNLKTGKIVQIRMVFKDKMTRIWNPDYLCPVFRCPGFYIMDHFQFWLVWYFDPNCKIWYHFFLWPKFVVYSWWSFDNFVWLSSLKMKYSGSKISGCLITGKSRYPDINIYYSYSISGSGYRIAIACPVIGKMDDSITGFVRISDPHFR